MHGQDQVIENGAIIGAYIYCMENMDYKDLLFSCIRAVKRGNYLAIFLFGAVAQFFFLDYLGSQQTLGLRRLVEVCA